MGMIQVGGEYMREVEPFVLLAFFPCFIFSCENSTDFL